MDSIAGCGVSRVVGPHNNSEDGAEHQSDDQINRLCPVLFQCPADQLYYTENAD